MAYYGTEHTDVARTAVSLGACYGALEDQQRQRDVLGHSLKVIEGCYGPNHVETASVKFNQALCFADMDDIPAAKEAAEDASKVFSKFYGPQHNNSKLIDQFVKDLKQ